MTENQNTPLSPPNELGFQPFITDPFTAHWQNQANYYATANAPR